MTLFKVIAVALVVATFALTTSFPGSQRPLATLHVANSSPQSLRQHVRESVRTVLRASRTTLTTTPAKIAVAVSSSALMAATAFRSSPTRSDVHVISLIQKIFPRHAWRDAEAVAWCESKFRASDIGFNSNGTHDRGLFQLNDGGTEQYLLGRLGLNPNNLALAFNPVTNARAAAVLYARDGWSQWTCSYVLA